ncbi:MAG: hypothetical protein HC848_07825 [Limnobacter sp.]|nr:hypothetical protein [Limnobacter sp.]
MGIDYQYTHPQARAGLAGCCFWLAHKARGLGDLLLARTSTTARVGRALVGNSKSRSYHSNPIFLALHN